MNRPKPVNSIVLSLFSGLALWLSFYSDLFFPLAWIALVPYLAFLWSRPGWWMLLAGFMSAAQLRPKHFGLPWKFFSWEREESQ